MTKPKKTKTNDNDNVWVLKNEPSYHYTIISLYGYKIGLWLNKEHEVIGVNTFKEDNISNISDADLEKLFDKIKHDVEELIPPWDSFKYQTSINDLAIYWWNKDYLNMPIEKVFEIIDQN